MEQSDLLRIVVSTLNDLGTPYFVTGSVAAMYYGEPRFTNDIDVVAKLKTSHISAFVACFPEEDFYLSRDAVERAVQRRSQFNIIHPESGLKVDVMIPADNEFNGSRFSRVVMVHPSSDYEAAFASPEDVIIKKLEYYHEGGSEKHIRDIVSILLISGDEVDRSYVSSWVAKLQLDTEWSTILERLKEKK